MPIFKRNQVRSGRIEVLAAHVKEMRRIAAEDPQGASALESFLMEDGTWEGQAFEATEKAPPQKMPPGKQPAAAASQGSVVTGQTQPLSEDEAMLEAELQRYLSRIAEEAAPDADSTYGGDDHDYGR